MFFIKHQLPKVLQVDEAVILGKDVGLMFNDNQMNMKS